MSAKSEFEASTHTVAFVVILLLSLLAYVLAKWVLGGTAVLVVALGLVVINALLVVIVLMNLGKQPTSNQIMLLAAGLLAATLVAACLLDVATRHTFPPRPVAPASAPWDEP